MSVGSESIILVPPHPRHATPKDRTDHLLKQLRPFAFTYLCQGSFSAMIVGKTKKINQLCLEKSLIRAVASLLLTNTLGEAQASH